MTRHQRGLLESYHQFKDQEDSCDLQDAAAAHAAAAASVEVNFVVGRRVLKRKRDLFSSSRPGDAATAERGGCPAEQREAAPSDVTKAGGCAKCVKCNSSCKGARRMQRRIQPDPQAPGQPQDPLVQEVQMEMTPFLTPETTPEKTPQKTSERSPSQRRRRCGSGDDPDPAQTERPPQPQSALRKRRLFCRLNIWYSDVFSANCCGLICKTSIFSGHIQQL